VARSIPYAAQLVSVFGTSCLTVVEPDIEHSFILARPAVSTGNMCTELIVSVQVVSQACFECFSPSCDIACGLGNNPG
jgi:hypothetical protein